MFEDARIHAVGEFESAKAGGAIDERRATGANGVQKCAQLRFQRFFRRGGDFHEIDGLLRILQIDADAQNILTGEIDGNIFVVLKKAHFANFFSGDPAGGEIRDGTGGKFDAGLGDIIFIGDDRNADGFDVDDRGVDQRKQNIQVVNHDVVDNVDVEAARSENSKTMDLEKHWFGNDFTDGDDRGVVALEMADLQNSLGALSRRDQTIGFAHRRGHGLFDQNIDAGIEQVAAHAAVLGSRDREANRFDLFGGQGVDVAEYAGFEFSGDLRGALGIGIDYADQFGAFHLTPDSGVVAAELADADYCNSNGVLIHDFLLTADRDVSLGSAPTGAKA